MPETQDSSGTTRTEAPPDILRRIVRTKRGEVEALLPRAPEIRSRAADAAPPRDFTSALLRGGEVALIAEVKRRSPGAGDIRPGLDPVDLARGYASRPGDPAADRPTATRRGGASAISVLTDREYFGGSLEDLAAVKAAVRVPVLRKDFTIHPLQVAEARAGGADAVLLIVRILEDALLRELADAAREWELTALVEVHDRAELDRAVAAGAEVVGINNRDLATFTTDLETTLGLLEAVPETAVVISESGIRAPEDVERLGAAGVDAVLVGESLLRADDPAAHAARLSGRRRVARG